MCQKSGQTEVRLVHEVFGDEFIAYLAEIVAVGRCWCLLEFHDALAQHDFLPTCANQRERTVKIEYGMEYRPPSGWGAVNFDIVA